MPSLAIFLAEASLMLRAGVSNVYICSAGDPTFLGQYVPVESPHTDGVATFENEDGRAIWRHQVRFCRPVKYA